MPRPRVAGSAMRSAPERIAPVQLQIARHVPVELHAGRAASIVAGSWPPARAGVALPGQQRRETVAEMPDLRHVTGPAAKVWMERRSPATRDRDHQCRRGDTRREDGNRPAAAAHPLGGELNAQAYSQSCPSPARRNKLMALDTRGLLQVCSMRRRQRQCHRMPTRGGSAIQQPIGIAEFRGIGYVSGGRGYLRYKTDAFVTKC